MAAATIADRMSHCRPSFEFSRSASGALHHTSALIIGWAASNSERKALVGFSGHFVCRNTRSSTAAAQSVAIADIDTLDRPKRPDTY